MPKPPWALVPFFKKIFTEKKLFIIYLALINSQALNEPSLNEQEFWKKYVLGGEAEYIFFKVKWRNLPLGDSVDIQFKAILTIIVPSDDIF